MKSQWQIPAEHEHCSERLNRPCKVKEFTDNLLRSQLGVFRVGIFVMEKSVPYVLLAILLLTQGCCTLFTSEPQTIFVDSEPSGVDVKIGPHKGKTPYTVTIPRGKRYAIEASYGADTQKKTLGRTVDRRYFGNILFFPGFIVDSVSGNMFEYKPTSYKFSFVEPDRLLTSSEPPDPTPRARPTSDQIPSQSTTKVAKGTESPEPTFVTRSPFDRMPAKDPPRIAKKWAVVVGISEYQQRGKWGLERLRYASSDAKAITDYLRSPKGGGFDRVDLLTDRGADVRSVKIALREKLRDVQKDDLVLIFWAGHGSPDPHEPGKLYLLGYDSDPEYMASTAYAMDEFRRDIRNVTANSVILIADACHSAGVSDPTQGVRGKNENKIVESFLWDSSMRGFTIGPAPEPAGANENKITGSPGGGTSDPAREPGVASATDGPARSVLIFTSCEAGEKSRESSTLDGGHGVFTFFLLEGLRGAADRPDNNGNGDGKVSLGELVDYTTDRVRRYTKNLQHPDTAGRFHRDATIGPVE